MKVQLILERINSHQITPDDWVKDTEHKIIEVEIPNIDNKNLSTFGKWNIIGYCEIDADVSEQRERITQSPIKLSQKSLDRLKEKKNVKQ